MRALIVVTVAIGIIGAVVVQKRGEATPPHTSAAKAAPVVAAKAPAAAEAAQSSQHHWPKRALDRAADVKRQVAEQRESDETR